MTFVPGTICRYSPGFGRYFDGYLFMVLDETKALTGPPDTQPRTYGTWLDGPSAGKNKWPVTCHLVSHEQPVDETEAFFV